MALRSGETLGPYEIVSPLGAGGMGEVYRARDPRLDRDVALKVLPEDISAPDRLRRFEDEARAVAALSHPHILAVYDIGRDDGTPYVVFELLDGQTLREHLRRGALPPRKVVELAEQLCQGLAAAHSRGIVHRDLKPANIFMTRDGPLKILDFGLARLTRERPPEDGSAVTETRPDVVLGTLGYLSPEQAQGKKAGARSDVFAVGAVLYEMLSGRRAFRGETTADALAAVLKEDPAELRPTAGPIPPALDRIVRRCLEKEPDDRFQSAKDVGFALEALSGSSTGPAELSAPPPPRSRWGRRLATGLLSVAFLALGALLGLHLSNPTPPTITQLTSRLGAVTSARFTPDGQSIVYSGRWQGRPSEILSKRLDSLEPARLGLPVGTILALSSTSELAVIETSEDNLGSPMIGTLGRVHLGSTSVRAVLEDVVSADWTPDGRLLALRRVEGRWQLEWPLGRVVQTWSHVHWHPSRLSPDGHTLAYLNPAGELHFLDSTGQETRAEGPSGRVQGFAWHPGTNEVWYTTWPLGPDVELRAVDRAGRDRLIHRFGNPVEIQDISVDGRVMVKFLSPAGVGFARVRAPGAQVEEDVSFHSRTLPLGLSANGRMVLLQKGFEEERQGGYFVRPTTSGSPTRVRGFDRGQAIDIAPEGERVLFLDSEPQPRLVSVPVGPGEPTPIAVDDVIPTGAKWFPDGHTILVKGHEKGQRDRLFVLNAGSPFPQPLTPAGRDLSSLSLDAVHVSPDGRTVAAHDGWAISLYPTGGGEPTPVLGYKGSDSLLGWTTDGHKLLLRKDRQSMRLPARLLLLDPATGETERLRDIMPPDLGGLSGVAFVRAALGGDAYAYYFIALPANFFLVDGLE